METLWSLGNKKLKSVEKNIYSNQLAHRVVEGIKNGGSEDDWVVWRPGWEKWQNIVEISELMVEVRLLLKINEKTDENKIEAPPLEFKPIKFDKNLESNSERELISNLSQIKVNPQPSNTDNHSQSHSSSQINSDASQSEDIPSWQNKRKHKRVEVRLRCIIRSETLTFRTFTKDISLGGVALEDPIPSDFIGTECNIYITAPQIKKNLKFKLQMTQRAGSRFFSFENTDPIFQTELNSWLENTMDEKKSNKVS